MRDELLDTLGRLLIDKPIWDKTKLLDALAPYDREVSLYTIQRAIETGTRFPDAFNRQSMLESKGTLYALRPVEIPQATVLDRVMKRTVRRGAVDLGEPEKAPEPVVEIAPNLLASKRATITFPADAGTRFSDAILDAYVFDHLLTEPEKRAYLRATPDFAPKLRVKTTGGEILIRGYNTFEPNEIPIGDDAERVKEWTDALAARFSEVIKTNAIFTSLNAGNEFTLSKLKVVNPVYGESTKKKKGKEKKVVLISGTVERDYETSSKSFKPTTCGTGCCKGDVMERFAQTVDKRGVGVPDAIVNVPSLCTYCELLAREETNCVWFTPEELSVLYGDPALSKRFTAEFKKTNPS